MIYYVKFHNLLPDKKKFFKTKTDIHPYLTELINEQILRLEKKLKYIDHDNQANDHEAYCIENNLRMLKLKDLAENELLRSVSITKVDEEICSEYEEIFKEK